MKYACGLPILSEAFFFVDGSLRSPPAYGLPLRLCWYVRMQGAFSFSFLFVLGSLRSPPAYGLPLR